MIVLNPEALRHKPQAVFLDLDDTLYAYEPAHAAAMGAVGAKANKAFNVSEKQFGAIFDAARSLALGFC